MARTKNRLIKTKSGNRRQSPSLLPSKSGGPEKKLTSSPSKKTRSSTKVKKKMGRPTDYNVKKNPDIASNLCTRYGADNTLLCTSFGISEVTLYQWIARYPEFAKAIKEGKDNYDSKHVESALLKRALGYSYTEVKTEDITLTAGRGESKISLPGTKTTKTIKQLAPDPTAMIFYLKNRQPERWRDVHKVEGSMKHDHNHKGNITIDDNPDNAAEVLNILAEAGIDLSSIDTSVKTTTH